MAHNDKYLTTTNQKHIISKNILSQWPKFYDTYHLTIPFMPDSVISFSMTNFHCHNILKSCLYIALVTKLTKPS